MIRRLIAVLVLALVTAVVFRTTSPASAVTYAEIEGSGSTWSQVILEQWIADVSASGMQVTYNGSGSSQGRKDFANGVTDFGISEIPYQGVDPISHQADVSQRPYAYLPIVAGGTAFTYQIKVAGHLVRNLRLSGATIAKIFTNVITNWNDPAITKDNNGHALPSLPIHPVVRSDGSGTTAQFTRWMDNQYPSIWRPYNGQAGLTSIYPRKGTQIAASGSDQVMNTIDGAAGNGTIGYVEYSYPLNAHYPVVKVENRAGYFVEPTQYNVAVALTKARIDTIHKTDPTRYLTQNLDLVYTFKDPRAYPISSYSYMIIPTGATDTRMTTAKRQTLADFLTYSICAGQGKAGPYGYSPLPLNLVKAGFAQIAKLGQADKGVNLTGHDPTKCDNPTFVKGNLSANHLAQIAPMPAACDKVGAGPCGTDTGTNTPSTDQNSRSNSTNGTPTSPTSNSSTAPTGQPGQTSQPTQPGSVPSAPAAIDPVTGQTAQTTTATAGQAVTPSAVELTSQRTGDSRLFGSVAVLELLAVVLGPGLYVAWRRRRGGLR